VATLNASDGQAPAAIVELTKGGGHVSVDELGIAATYRSSIMSLRKRGRRDRYDA